MEFSSSAPSSVFAAPQNNATDARKAARAGRRTVTDEVRPDTNATSHPTGTKKRTVSDKSVYWKLTQAGNDYLVSFRAMPSSVIKVS